jgi:hypothetical protein
MSVFFFQFFLGSRIDYGWSNTDITARLRSDGPTALTDEMGHSVARNLRVQFRTRHSTHSISSFAQKPGLLGPDKGSGR